MSRHDRVAARRSAFRFGFAAGLPVFWICYSAHLSDVVPRALPPVLLAVYLLHVGVASGIGHPDARWNAAGALAVGMAMGYPLLWPVWIAIAFPLLVVRAGDWISRRGRAKRGAARPGALANGEGR